MLMKRFAIVAFVIWSLACGLGQTAPDQSPAGQSEMRKNPVAVGEVAPDFTLEDQARNKVTLSESRDKSPVVLVFYRGYW